MVMQSAKTHQPIEDVSKVLFTWWTDRTLKYKGTTYKQGDLQGVSASYARVLNMSMQEGRFLSEIDDEHRRPAMVIGVGVAEALFPHQTQIVGEQVELAGQELRDHRCAGKEEERFLWRE
jgi:hypothetical protein